MSLRRKLGVGLGLALSAASLSGVLAATASAQVDPAGCPQDVTFDPASGPGTRSSRTARSPATTPPDRASGT